MTTADNNHDIPESDFDRLLGGLYAAEVFPATPDLSGAVGDRLRAMEQGSHRRRFLQRRRLAIAAAIAIFIIAGSIAAIPDSRDAVADWFGLRSVNVVQLTEAPTPPETPVSLDLGSPATLEQAADQVQFTILMPTLAGYAQPDHVYVQDWPPGGQIAFVYAPRNGLPETNVSNVGLLLTEFRADLNHGPVTKGILPGTTLEQITVDGQPGIWIEGAAHVFFYTDATGAFESEQIRLAGNTLLWEAGDLTLRLESALSRDEAIRFAETLVPVQ